MYGIILLVIIGLFAGLCLAYASKKFFVAKDAKVQEVLDALPRTNCGGCGYAGCAQMAQLMVAGTLPITACTAADEGTVSVLARIMGITAEAMVKRVARLTCGGGSDKCAQVADYDGPMDCGVMAVTSGGGKGCVYGCMGGGSCVKVCVYDAMKMGATGLPEINEAKCTVCGLCIQVCPRKLLRLIPQASPVYVACFSTDKGPAVKKVCEVGCIACKICEKNCLSEAITVENFVASVNPDKCTACNICVEKCPTKSILSR